MMLAYFLLHHAQRRRLRFGGTEDHRPMTLYILFLSSASSFHPLSILSLLFISSSYYQPPPYTLFPSQPPLSILFLSSNFSFVHQHPLSGIHVTRILNFL